MSVTFIVPSSLYEMSYSDGTYTAYVDYTLNGVIESRYIITLEANRYPISESKFKFNYTVIAAVTFA